MIFISTRQGKLSNRIGILLFCFAMSLLSAGNLPASNPFSANISFTDTGKALQLNFGASMYRVVAIDLSDAVFEPVMTEIRIQWRPRMNTLLEQLHKAPSVLRLSYIADSEDAALVDRRMEVIKRQLTQDAASDSQRLTIEPEVFWRLGGSPKRRNLPLPGRR